MFKPAKKGGRKPGSGAGEKRKKPDQYSNNKNTQRDRDRKAKMNQAQRDVDRAGGADRTALSRAVKLLKESEGWTEMTPEEQEIAVTICKAEFWEARYVTIVVTRHSRKTH